MEYLEIIFRSIVVYIFIVIGMRVFGKRELSQISIVDLAFILLISNSVQTAMVGESISLEGGIVAAGTLFATNHLVENLIFRSKKFSHFLQGDPLILAYKGKPNPKHMSQAKISMEDLEAAVREHGVYSIKETEVVIFERDGNISVMGKNIKKQSTRRRRAHKIVQKYL